MKINGNIDSQTGNWGSIKNHVDRNYKNDDNKKSINSKYTKYNLSGVVCDVTAVLHRHYDKWLREHNTKMKKQGRPKRIKTFKQIVKGSSGKRVANRQVMTFGTIKDKHLQMELISKDYPNLSSGQVKRRYCQAVSHGLKRYAIHYNERNKFVPMGHYETNVEEKGAPHLHCEVIPLGFTKKGKPSRSLSSALKRQFHTNNRNKAISAWSKQEDMALVHDVGATLALRFRNVPEFKKWKLQHTHAPQHQNEVEYKRSESEKTLKREQKRLAHQNKLAKNRLKRKAKRIEARHAKFKSYKKQWKLVEKKRLHDYYHVQAVAVANKDLKQRESKVDKRIHSYISKQSKVAENAKKRADSVKISNENLEAENYNLKSDNHNLQSKNSRLNRENSTLKSGIKELKSTYNHVVDLIKNKLGKGVSYFQHAKNKIQAKIHNTTKSVDDAFSDVTKNLNKPKRSKAPLGSGYAPIKQGYSDTPKGFKPISNNPENDNQIPSDNPLDNDGDKGPQK